MLYVNNETYISLGKEFWQCLPEVLVSLSEVDLTEVRVATPMTDCVEHGARSVYIGNTNVKIRVSSAPSDIKIIVVLATHGLSFLRRA